MSDENRIQREERLAAEYAAYFKESESRRVEAINFINWQHSKKVADKQKKGERAFDRREVRLSKAEMASRQITEKRKPELKSAAEKAEPGSQRAEAARNAH